MAPFGARSMTVFTLALAWEASTLPGPTLSIPTFISDENDELYMDPTAVAAMDREKAQWEDRERARDPEAALTAPRVRGQSGGPRGAWGLGASVSEPDARTVRATAVRQASSGLRPYSFGRDMVAPMPQASSGAWALPRTEIDRPESSDLRDDARPEIGLRDELDLPQEQPELQQRLLPELESEAAGKWHFFQAGMAGLLHQDGTVTTPRYRGNGRRSGNTNTWTVTSVKYQRESGKVVGGVVGMKRNKQNSAMPGSWTKSELIYFGEVGKLLDDRTGKIPKFWREICPIPGSRNYAEPSDWVYSSPDLSEHSQH